MLGAGRPTLRTTTRGQKAAFVQQIHQDKHRQNGTKVLHLHSLSPPGTRTTEQCLLPPPVVQQIHQHKHRQNGTKVLHLHSLSPPGTRTAVPPPSSLRAERIEGAGTSPTSTTTENWSLVQAEHRPHWRASPTMTPATAGIPLLSASDREDAMLQEALTCLGMDVDTEPLMRLADREEQGMVSRHPIQDIAPAGSGSVEPRTPCRHARTTTRGSNAHYKIVKCLDCNMILQRENFTASPSSPQEEAPAAVPVVQAVCHHHRVTWKGTNSHQWRKSCLDCGHVTTGPAGQPASTGSRTSAGSNVGATTSMPLRTGPELPTKDVLLSRDEVVSVMRAFTAAVAVRLSTLPPEGQLRSSTLQAALALTLRLTAVWNEDDVGSVATMPRANSQPAQGGNLTVSHGEKERLRVKGQEKVSQGKHRGHAVYQVQLDGNYREWIFANIDENSTREMKWLKNYLLKIHEYEIHHGALFLPGEITSLLCYMAIEEDLPTGGEGDLVAVLDTGCNTTCHGAQWLARYPKVTGAEAPELQPDGGGSFRGIGRRMNTAGTRDLSLCLELADGGLAKGNLRSVEL